VKRFAEALLKLAGGSMPAADLLAAAKQALAAGNARDAGATFEELLGQEPENAEAWGGLVRALIASGKEKRAAEILAGVPAKLAEHAEIAGARSALTLAQEGRAAKDRLQSLAARVAAEPGDWQARYELAAALNATGSREEAAEQLLEIVRRRRDWNDGAARLQLLRLFEAWGLDDPVTVAARRKLSALLFA
jgi:putative thioredoxin